MTSQPKPDFSNYKFNDLAQLAIDLLQENNKLKQANDQLTADLKDSMKELRKFLVTN